MCQVNGKGEKVSDCGSCICTRSSNYDKHDYQPTGETVTVGKTLFATRKCVRGCGSYP